MSHNIPNHISIITVATAICKSIKNFPRLRFVNVHIKSVDFKCVTQLGNQTFEMDLSFLFPTCIESFFIFKGISASDFLSRCFFNLLQHM